MSLYKNKNLIYYGLNCKVYSIEKDNKKYVMKVLLNKNDNELNIYSIINDLDNKYLVKFIEKIDNCLIYEFCEYNTLENLLYQIDNNKLIKIISQLVEFFILLRDKGYYYNDLSLNNILIDQNYKIKVIDYGSLYKIGNIPKDITGTYGFISPEYLKENILDYEKNFVFSCGVILFLLYFKFYLFKKSSDYFKKCWNWCDKSECNRNDCLSKYLDKKSIDQTLKKILLNCLKFNHKDRITINKLKVTC